MLRRIDAVWRTRGPGGFARFIASRVFSRRRDLVFEADAAGLAPPPPWEGPGELVCVTPATAERLLTPSLVAQLSQGEGAAYVEGLRGGDMLVAVVDESGRILHHSFVLFRTRTKALLAEAQTVPLFANCVTRAEARGHRIYPRALRHGLGMLAALGHARAVINCDPSNRASVRGIEYAGFRLIRETVTWSVLSRIALQVGHDPAGRRFVRIYWG